VLLDTWNIQGHESLNLKEAIPQLACVAFELMREGTQTATEKELLSLLEKAREKVPQIRRYAKDTPDQFLKRVELRSSLLVEAGHQLEGTRTVAFYQFRHLTFQEYLAAVAAVEGHYMHYQPEDTVLSPLSPDLTAEKWKEVIPMAAVLAKKQAEPLISALVTEANSSRRFLEQKATLGEPTEWLGEEMPAPAARLLQCLVEEAEASPETLSAALQVLAFFGRNSDADSWQRLSRGPYGQELLHQAWLLYAPMNWPRGSLMRNTLARFVSFRRPAIYWESGEGCAELARLLGSQSGEEIVQALLVIAALQWGDLDREDFVPIPIPLAEMERHLFQQDYAIWHAAAWSLALTFRRHESLKPTPAVLDRLLDLWMTERDQKLNYTIVSFALAQVLGLPRESWAPTLTEAQQKRLVLAAQEGFDRSDLLASLMVAFHAREPWSDEELANWLNNARIMHSDKESERRIDATLEQIGELTRSIGDKRQKRK
jgi:hypothetical protein